MLSQRVKNSDVVVTIRLGLVFLPSAASALSSSAVESLGPRCRFRDSDFIRQIHRHEIPDGQRLAACAQQGDKGAQSRCRTLALK
jgi:hypothetical protein